MFPHKSVHCRCDQHRIPEIPSTGNASLFCSNLIFLERSEEKGERNSTKRLSQIPLEILARVLAESGAMSKISAHFRSYSKLKPFVFQSRKSTSMCITGSPLCLNIFHSCSSVNSSAFPGRSFTSKKCKAHLVATTRTSRAYCSTRSLHSSGVFNAATLPETQSKTRVFRADLLSIEREKTATSGRREH